ncbi:MAG: hypothetical protein RMI91_11860 [Gemmatales bacterium]|nr:hypothetical protein [Gemmatales bacterium]MDW7995335.1 hypothetical protein [Gemmatales bacterium]
MKKSHIRCANAAGGCQAQRTGDLVGQPLRVQAVHDQLPRLQRDGRAGFLADANKVIAAMLNHLQGQAAIGVRKERGAFLARSKKAPDPIVLVANKRPPFRFDGGQAGQRFNGLPGSSQAVRVLRPPY